MCHMVLMRYDCPNFMTAFTFDAKTKKQTTGMYALTLYNHDQKQDVGDSFVPQTMTRHKQFGLCGIGWLVMHLFVQHEALGMSNNHSLAMQLRGAVCLKAVAV
jgi:hypothetical protein